jgi:hypothetical protein
VTRRVEEKIAENSRVEKIESNTRTGLTSIIITLVDGTPEVGKEFDDIKLKLDGIHDLPDGAGPINFVKDFGDTAGLMLTVASPKVGPTEIAVRARSIQEAIARVRADAGGQRVTFAHGLPASVSPHAAGDRALVAYLEGFVRERMRASEIHPDAWPAIVIRDPGETVARLAAVAGDKYSYRELDDYTDLIVRTLKGLPIVSKVTRSGLLDERVFLEYSQERLAAYGVTPSALRNALNGRNNLRDLADVSRAYVSPPSFLNFYGARGKDGEWQRTRSITVGVQMRGGQQIDAFGVDVDARIADLRQRRSCWWCSSRSSASGSGDRRC